MQTNSPKNKTPLMSEMLAGHFSHPPTAEAMYAYIDINMTSITHVSCLTGFQNFLLKMVCKCLQRFFKQAPTSGKRVCYANRKGNFSPSLQTSKLHHKRGFGISWKDRNIIYDEFFHPTNLHVMCAKKHRAQHKHLFQQADRISLIVCIGIPQST